jgi:hypothetical protein
LNATEAGTGDPSPADGDPPLLQPASMAAAATMPAVQEADIEILIEPAPFLM